MSIKLVLFDLRVVSFHVCGRIKFLSHLILLRLQKTAREKHKLLTLGIISREGKSKSAQLQWIKICVSFRVEVNSVLFEAERHVGKRDN